MPLQECYNFGEDFFDWWEKTMGNYDKDLEIN